MSTRRNSASHGGSKSSAKRSERSSPSNSHGKVLSRSVSSSMCCRNATPSAFTSPSRARPLRSSEDHARDEIVGRGAARLRQPVAFVAQPRVVQDRRFHAVESGRGDDRPVRVAAPFAETVHRMPTGEHEIDGARHAQVRGEEDAADGGQYVDDRPQRRAERGERLENRWCVTRAIRHVRLRRARSTRR